MASVAKRQRTPQLVRHRDAVGVGHYAYEDARAALCLIPLRDLTEGAGDVFCSTCAATVKAIARKLATPPIATEEVERIIHPPAPLRLPTPAPVETALPAPLPPGVTVGANGRRYPRTFNHEQVVALHRQGASIARLADHFGVSYQGLRRVVDPAVRKQMDRATRAFLMAGVCETCGGETVIAKYRNVSGRVWDGRLVCRSCRGYERRTRYRLDDLGHLAAVSCTTCKVWKYPEEFGRKAVANWEAGKTVRNECRACQTKARTAFRNRRRIPCTRCGKPRTHPDELGGLKRKKADTGLCFACFQAKYMVGHAGSGIRQRDDEQAA